MKNEIKVSQWHGFQRLDFSVAKRDCLLVEPKLAASNRPWIWRTEFFGHEPQADIALLERGYHVAYMDVQNMYGAPQALDLMDEFYAYLREWHQLSAKPVLEGFSRGGLYALNWAARNPLRVSALYLDAPVCDWKSWPAGLGHGTGSPDNWAELKEVYGLTDEEAMTSPPNPINNLQPLAIAKIPILSVCGDADEVVPLEENTGVLEQRYRELGGEIQVIVKPGIGHHPHSLVDPAPIVEFVMQHTT